MRHFPNETVCIPDLNFPQLLQTCLGFYVQIEKHDPRRILGHQKQMLTGRVLAKPGNVL